MFNMIFLEIELNNISLSFDLFNHKQKMIKFVNNFNLRDHVSRRNSKTNAG